MHTRVVHTVNPERILVHRPDYYIRLIDEVADCFSHMIKANAEEIGQEGNIAVGW